MCGEFAAAEVAATSCVYWAACWTSGLCGQRGRATAQHRDGAGLCNQTRLNVERAAENQDNHRKASKMAGPAEPWVPTSHTSQKPSRRCGHQKQTQKF